MHFSFLHIGHHRPSWIWACTEKIDQIWKFYQNYFESSHDVEKENTKLYSKKEKYMDLPPVPWLRVFIAVAIHSFINIHPLISSVLTSRMWPLCWNTSLPLLLTKHFNIINIWYKNLQNRPCKCWDMTVSYMPKISFFVWPCLQKYE